MSAVSKPPSLRKRFCSASYSLPFLLRQTDLQGSSCSPTQQVVKILLSRCLRNSYQRRLCVGVVIVILGVDVNSLAENAEIIRKLAVTNTLYRHAIAFILSHLSLDYVEEELLKRVERRRSQSTDFKCGPP